VASSLFASTGNGLLSSHSTTQRASYGTKLETIWAKWWLPIPRRSSWDRNSHFISLGNTCSTVIIHSTDLLLPWWIHALLVFEQLYKKALLLNEECNLIQISWRANQRMAWSWKDTIQKIKSIECHLYKFNDPMPLLRRRASTFHFFKPSSYHSIYKWAQVKANTLFTDGMNIEKTCISGLNWKYRTQVYQSPVLPRQRHEYLALVVEFSKEKTADSAWPSVNQRLTSVIAQIVVLNSTCMQRARFEEMNIYNDRWYLGK